MADVDTRAVAKAFKIEINGQFLPIKSYSGGDLTAEKAEASSGSSQQSESTVGHNYIAEEIGAKVLALHHAGVAFRAIKKLVGHINNSFRFTKKFMETPEPIILKNIKNITRSTPVWNPAILWVGTASVIFALVGVVLIGIPLAIGAPGSGPTGSSSLLSPEAVNAMVFTGLGTGVLAVGLSSIFLTQQRTAIGFIGLLLGGLAIFLFFYPLFSYV